MSVHKEIEAIKEAQAAHTIHQAAAFMRENGQHDLAEKWLDEMLESEEPDNPKPGTAF